MSKFNDVLKEKNTTLFNIASKMGREDNLNNLQRISRGEANFGVVSTSTAFVISRMLDCSVEDLLEEWEIDGTAMDVQNIQNIFKRLDKLVDKDDPFPILVAPYNKTGLLLRYTQEDEAGDLVILCIEKNGTYTAYRAYYTDTPEFKEAQFYRLDSEEPIFTEKAKVTGNIDFLDENKKEVLDAVTKGLEPENMEKITPEDFFFDARYFVKALKRYKAKQK